MIRTRETLGDLERMARTLVMRPASNEELRDAVLYLIETVRRLVDEVEEAQQGAASAAALRGADISGEISRIKQSS